MFLKAFILFSLWLLSSCGHQRVAGVITETESGKKILGKILDANHKPLAQTQVALFVHNFNYEQITTTDSAGFFAFDSLNFDSLTLVALSHDQAWALKQELVLQSDSSDLNIQLQKSAQLALTINPKSHHLGDSLCLNHSLNCVEITSKHLEQQIVLFTGLAPGTYTELHNKNTENSIDLLIDLSAETLNFVDQSGQQNTIQDTISFDYEFTEALQIEHSFVFPIIGSEDMSDLQLFDLNNNAVNLDTVFAYEDKFIHWYIAPELSLNLGKKWQLQRFSKNSTTPHKIDSPLRLFNHFEGESPGIIGHSIAFNADDEPYILSTAETFVDSQALGYSFWLKADGEVQQKAYTRFFDTRLDNVGITIQQRVGQILETRIDTKEGEYNSIFGKAQILDNEWHQYAFSIHKDHLRIWSDGIKITDTIINFGEGFSNSTHALIGANPMLIGQIDEAMFFNSQVSDQWVEINFILQSQSKQWIFPPNDKP